MRVAIDGGKPQVVVAARRTFSPRGLHADGGMLFYFNDRTVVRVEVQTRKLVELVSDVLPAQLTIDDQFVYFVDCAIGECTYPTVRRVPRQGGSHELLGAGHGGASRIALIEDDLQWGSRVLPKNGGPERTLRDGGLVIAIAPTPQAFYFADFYTGVIYRAPR